MPPACIAVSESGLQDAADLERLARGGLRAFLIGERFMTDAPIRAAGAARALLGAGERRRDPFVKICGITRAEDADAGGELGATALGFVFWPASPRCDRAASGAGDYRALPPFVTTVGVFVNQPADDDRSGGGLRRASAPCSCTATRRRRTPARSHRAGDQGDDADRRRRRARRRVADGTMLLLDAHDPVRRGGTGRTVDWTRAARRRARAGASCWPAG